MHRRHSPRTLHRSQNPRTASRTVPDTPGRSGMQTKNLRLILGGQTKYHTLEVDRYLFIFGYGLSALRTDFGADIHHSPQPGPGKAHERDGRSRRHLRHPDYGGRCLHPQCALLARAIRPGAGVRDQLRVSRSRGPRLFRNFLRGNQRYPAGGLHRSAQYVHLPDVQGLHEIRRRELGQPVPEFPLRLQPYRSV